MHLRLFAALAAILVVATPSAHALDFYVDAAIGDDARQPLDAQSEATPWRTVGRALRAVGEGHVIRVKPGRYSESLQTSKPGVTLLAEGALGDVIVAPGAAAPGLVVGHPGVVVEGIVFEGGSHGIRADAADGVTIRGCVAVGQSANGFTLLDTNGALVDGSSAISAAGRGILLKRSDAAYLRNNLVYANGEGGIAVEGRPAAVSTGHLLAFNTVAFNGGSGAAGVALLRAEAEVRDSIVVASGGAALRIDTPGAHIHHLLLAGVGVPIEPGDYEAGAALRSGDPRFVAPAGTDGILGGIDGWRDDDFSLGDPASGQTARSPAIDAGSAAVTAADISGSTRSDDFPDEGRADLGFHRGAYFSRGIPDRTPRPPGAPAPGAGAEQHVDCATGSDARTKLEARDPATPWRTIQRATLQAGYGDVIVVAPGECREAVETNVGGIAIRAREIGQTVIAPPAGKHGVNVQHDDVTVAGFVIRSSHQGVLGAKAKAGELLVNLVLRDLVIEPPAGELIATNGIQVRDAERVTIESVVVRGAEQQGIVLKRVGRAYVRNNLVHGNPNDWGISLDGDSPNRFAPQAGNVVAFNTVVGNGRGLRLRNAAGEVRDNVVAQNAGAGLRYTEPDAAWMVHHNDAWGNAPDYDLPSGVRVHGSNASVEPGFVDAGGWDFALRQVAGEGVASPLVDAGSGEASALDVDGSTASDGRPDTGRADLGYHAGARASSLPPGGDGPRATPPGTPTPRPAPGAGAEQHVDCATGSDARTKLEARDPATPWRTIQRATLQAGYGDVIVVAPGECREAVETNVGGIAIRAREIGQTVIAPPVGKHGVNVQHDDVTVAGFVIRSSHQGVLGAKAKAGELLVNLVLRDLVIEPPAGELIATNGIQVRDAERVTIESVVVRGAEQQGIVLKRVGRAYVRNNLVHGNPNDWGISLDGDSPNRFAPQAGNVVAFNTVVGNGRGLRLRNAAGEVRDNVVAQNAGAGLRYTEPDAAWMVHHNDAWGNAPDYDLPSGVRVHGSNASVEPGFVDAGGWDFALRQVAGEGVASPLVDAGSGEASALDVDGSTASDGRPDTGRADLGYHAGARASSLPPGGDGPRATPPAPPTPTPTPSPTPGPLPPGAGSTFFVDPSGDDARGLDAARSPAGAWRTLARAMNGASPGDVIALRPGVYREQADFKRDAITLRGDGPLGTVVLAPPAGKAGIYVDGRRRIRVHDLVVEGAAQGVVARAAHDLDLRGVVAAASASNGMSIADTDLVWIRNSIVTGSGAMGIKLKRASGVYVSNNLVYGNAGWGISIDATTKPASPPTRDNVVAFNTVHANDGGVRYLNASGEVRDNLLTGHADLALYVAAPDVLVHHNLFAGNGRDRDQKNRFRDAIFAWENVGKSPRYADAAGPDGVLGGLGWRDDDFRLQQVAAGDAVQSGAVDAASGTPAALDIDGTTSRDGRPDDGIADVGFHYGASPATAPPPPAAVGHRLAVTYYVSASAGDDARTKATAKNRSTPWRTIARAMRNAGPGDTVVVLPGHYRETAQIDVADVTVRAEAPGEAVLEPAAGNGITIEATGVTVDGFVVQGGVTGISVTEGMHGATIRNCAAVASRTDGIRAVDADDVAIEHSIATGNVGSGIRIKRGFRARVRNDLVYANGEWGVSIDASGAAHPVSTGHLIAHSTVAFNAAGNVILLAATGEVRDNLVGRTPGRGVRLEQPDVLLHHNGFFANATALQPASYLFSCTVCEENRPIEPRFVDVDGADGVLGGAGWRDDDFRLAHAAAGQPQDSQAIDRGSEAAGPTGLSGTTSTDGAPDVGRVDLGFHYASSPRALPAPASP